MMWMEAILVPVDRYFEKNQWFSAHFLNFQTIFSPKNQLYSLASRVLCFISEFAPILHQNLLTFRRGSVIIPANRKSNSMLLEIL
jgi:hypothetical protein